MDSLAFIPLVGPVALAFAAWIALRAPREEAGRALRASWLAAVSASGVAAVAGLTLAYAGPMTSPLIGVLGVGLSVRLDSLSVVLYGLVSFVGLVVIRYSRNYMAGDSRHGAFVGQLSVTLGLVFLLVTSGNLGQLLTTWTATSLALQKLLSFYAERPRAQLAAKKKFIVARASDICLTGAAGLMALTFGSMDIETIAARARAVAGGGRLDVALSVATLLLVAAAGLKSAQFPFHAWLVEAMDTPTPVSALLHAGIINAGGFLLVRFADVMLLNTHALHMLALAGLSTALIGSLVMVTQTNIKGYLAWSTVAQMGFMLLQCGFGAFSAAVLHIVGHSLYKAYAFLNSGSAVEAVRHSASLHTRKRPVLGHAAVSVLIVSALFVTSALMLGSSAQEESHLVVFGSVIVLGLTDLLVRTAGRATSILAVAWPVSVAIAVSAAYVGMQALGVRIFADAVPVATGIAGENLSLSTLTVLGFGLLVSVQLAGFRSGHSWCKAAYVHCSNGFYVNALLNRMLGAGRVTSERKTTEV